MGLCCAELAKGFIIKPKIREIIKRDRIISEKKMVTQKRISVCKYNGIWGYWEEY